MASLDGACLCCWVECTKRMYGLTLDCKLMEIQVVASSCLMLQTISS